MNLRRLAIIPMALLLLPIFSACVSVLSPTGWASVAFEDDVAYLTTSKGRLSAVEIKGDSAIARWTFPDKDRDEDDKFKTRAIYGPPIIDGDRLYLATFSGGVFALNKADGRPVWPTTREGNNSRYDGDIAGGLAEAGDNIFFGTTEGHLYGWKKSDGTAATGWEKPKSVSGGIWATPVVQGDTIFVATMDGGVHAFSTADGSERWSEPFESSGAIADLSLIGEDLLFVPSINHRAYFVRTADGSLASEFKANDWLWTSPATDESKVFFADFKGNVYGVDITTATARKLWEPASVDGERVRSGPALIDDVLIVADRKPVVTFLNAADGQVLNRVPIPDAGTIRANLVVRDGAAYFGTTGGRLFRAEPQGRRVVEIQLSGVKK